MKFLNCLQLKSKNLIKLKFSIKGYHLSSKMLILLFLIFESIAATCGTCFRDRGDGTCTVDPSCYSVTCGTDGFFKLIYNKGSWRPIYGPLIRVFLAYLRENIILIEPG